MPTLDGLLVFIWRPDLEKVSEVHVVVRIQKPRPFEDVRTRGKHLSGSKEVRIALHQERIGRVRQQPKHSGRLRVPFTDLVFHGSREHAARLVGTVGRPSSRPPEREGRVALARRESLAYDVDVPLVGPDRQSPATDLSYL